MCVCVFVCVCVCVCVCRCPVVECKGGRRKDKEGGGDEPGTTLAPNQVKEKPKCTYNFSFYVSTDDGGRMREAGSVYGVGSRYGQT